MTVPYGGGHPENISSVPLAPGAVETTQDWATKNLCDPTPDTSQPEINPARGRLVGARPTPRSRAQHYTGCQANGDAELWTILGAPHSPPFWPSRRAPDVLDSPAGPPETVRLNEREREYTRREEVRWTLIASLLITLCIAPAVILLGHGQAAGSSPTSPGPPPRRRRRRAHRARPRLRRRRREAPDRDRRLQGPGQGRPPRRRRRRRRRQAPPGPRSPRTVVPGPLQPQAPGEGEDRRPWVRSAAQPSQKAAGGSAGCRPLVEGAVGCSTPTPPGRLHRPRSPPSSPPPPTRPRSFRGAHAAPGLGYLPVDAGAADEDAGAAAQKQSDDLTAKADVATVIEPSRTASSLAGLQYRRRSLGDRGSSASYLSVRVVSNRRPPPPWSAARGGYDQPARFPRRRRAAMAAKPNGATSPAPSSAAPSAAWWRRAWPPSTPTSSSAA